MLWFIHRSYSMCSRMVVGGERVAGGFWEFHSTAMWSKYDLMVVHAELSSASVC